MKHLQYFIGLFLFAATSYLLLSASTRTIIFLLLAALPVAVIGYERTKRLELLLIGFFSITSLALIVYRHDFRYRGVAPDFVTTFRRVDGRWEVEERTSKEYQERVKTIFEERYGTDMKKASIKAAIDLKKRAHDHWVNSLKNRIRSLQRHLRADERRYGTLDL